MQIAGDADAQRLRHRLVQRDHVMAHHRAVRIEKAPGKQRRECCRQKDAQRRRRLLRGKAFAQPIRYKTRRRHQKPQPQQRNQPRLRDKQLRHEAGQRGERQAIASDKHRSGQPTAALATQHEAQRTGKYPQQYLQNRQHQHGEQPTGHQSLLIKWARIINQTAPRRARCCVARFSPSREGRFSNRSLYMSICPQNPLFSPPVAAVFLPPPLPSICHPAGRAAKKTT